MRPLDPLGCAFAMPRWPGSISLQPLPLPLLPLPNCDSSAPAPAPLTLRALHLLTCLAARPPAYLPTYLNSPTQRTQLTPASWRSRSPCSLLDLGRLQDGSSAAITSGHRRLTHDPGVHDTWVEAAQPGTSSGAAFPQIFHQLLQVRCGSFRIPRSVGLSPSRADFSPPRRLPQFHDKSLQRCDATQNSSRRRIQDPVIPIASRLAHPSRRLVAGCIQRRQALFSSLRSPLWCSCATQRNATQPLGWSMFLVSPCNHVTDSPDAVNTGL